MHYKLTDGFGDKYRFVSQPFFCLLGVNAVQSTVNSETSARARRNKIGTLLEDPSLQLVYKRIASK